ncbi:MAG: protein kinase domain-containing protein [Marinicella sp.]
MTDETQQLIESIFHQALELPETEQTKFVNSQLSERPELIKEVMGLLAATRQESISLDRVLQSPVLISGDLDAQDKDLEFKTIGSYMIEREISHGGMGRVFLGRRNDQEFDNQVAIKLVRVDRRSAWAEAKFKEERQILANLNHGNIAMMLDGGTTENGQPYVVMEYVDGLHINEYIKNNNLSVSEKLHLFIQVCGAISHAHKNLVIHRDIKPSNIMVNADGVPKLLDFGIAKMMSEGQDMNATATQMAMMTPTYASPEQIRGEVISTASDIYSLGILLYELLTEKPPFEVGSASPAEIVKAVCDTQPVRPSDAAENNLTGRRLRGDLDNIIFKAINKDVLRRYESVDGLVTDIKDHLEGRPVVAAPDSRWYRFKKFIGRNQWSMSAAVMFAITLATVVGYYTWQLATERDKALTAKQEAVSAAEMANQEAQTANRVSEFLIGIFEANDPRAGMPGKDLTARQLLDLGAQSLTESLDEEPTTKAHLWRTIGLAYAHMGEMQAGIDSLRQSLALHQAHSDPLAIGEAMNRLAEILRKDDQFDEAVELHREAIKLHETSQQVPTWELADAHNNFGLLLYNLGQYDEAEKSLKKAIVTHRAAAGGQEAASVGINMHNLSLILRVRGKFKEAEEMIKTSLDITAQFRGEDSTSWIVSLQQLGRIQNDLGLYNEALNTVDKALKMGAKHYNPDNPRLATMYGRKANSFHALGRYQEAEEMYQKSLSIYADAHGPDSWNGAYMELYYGQMLLTMGRFDEAHQIISHSLKVRKSLFNEDHPGIAIAQTNLAEANLYLGNLPRAEQLLSDAFVLLNKRFEQAHPELAWTHLVAAKLNRLQNNLQSANDHINQIQPVFDHPTSWSPLNQVLAYVEWYCLKHELKQDNQQQFERASSILTTLDSDHPLIGKLNVSECR